MYTVIFVCYLSLFSIAGNFTALVSLDLSLNSLYGTLPKNIYSLFNLQVLNLDTNQLHGTLSNEVGRLSNLEVIILRKNQIHGTIPSTIGDLSHLTYMRLSVNLFTGTIPDSISNLKNLTLFILTFNALTGTLPYWIGDLQRLSIVALGPNDFVGTVTSSICKLSELMILYIDECQFTGTIPSCFEKLAKLETLNMAGNYLTGTIPSGFSKISSLSLLFLGNNMLSGSIPSSFSTLSQLQQLYLPYNMLTGNIIDIFNSSIGMVYVILYNNLLTGSMPVSFASMPSLNELFVENNCFSGNLHSAFNSTVQRRLSNVQLSNNQFTGTLPEQLFSSTNLVSVSAVSNCFHGTIPRSICNNAQLETLALDGLVCASSCRKKILPAISPSYVSSRSITGGIPDCLWSMPRLQVLHLSGNSLTGTLPTYAVNISRSLRDLSLSFNLLRGSIPNDIQNRAWTNLDLSNNRISGTLSASFNTTVNSSSSVTLDNNRLSGYIPSTLHDTSKINILKGSYYTCKYDRSDLPKHDSNNDIYDCGSSTWNVLYFVWLGLAALTVVTVLILYYYREQFEQVSFVISNLTQWLSVINSSIADESCINMGDFVNSKLKSMLYLQRYIAMHGMLLRISLCSTIFIVIILMPIYVALSIYYRSHTYEYAWAVAFMYLAGRVAFGIGMVALMILIILQVFVYIYTLKQNSHLFSFTMYEEKGQGQMHNIVNNCNKRLATIWTMYILYITINLCIVSGVNLGYVVVILTQSRSIIILAEILLSVFKLVWNNAVSPLMVRWIVGYLSIDTISQQSTLFFLQFVVSIFNNIIIPCFIVLIISPNCFNNVFNQESDVKSTFPTTVCSIESPYNTCLLYGITYSTTSYSPPFTYSYQCSSSFITYYSPVFMLVCIISTFVIPILQMIWIKLKKSNSMFFNLSRLLHPTRYHSNIPVLLDIDEIYKLLVFELTLVGLILTFGTIFPPLAVAFFMTACGKVYYHQAILGRYITSVANLKVYSQLDMLENNLKVQPLVSTIRKCGWVLIYTACSFYTLFLFDILADDVGFYKAYWVLIVIPCIPLCIYALRNFYFRFISVQSHTQAESSDGIQMSQALAFVSNPLSVDKKSGHNSFMIDFVVADRDGDSIGFAPIDL